jgi:hypothetical protein
MFNRTQVVLSVAIMFGNAWPTAQAGVQNPAVRQPRLTIQGQAPTDVYEGHGFVQARDQGTRMAAVYFDPNPAPFKAFTYCASVQLSPPTPKRGLKGEFRFPAFSATPNVSVQIISSVAATPVQVTALKVADIADNSGAIETQIIVEAETIFDVPANGIFYANVVVIGIPVSPPPTAKAVQLSN